MVRRHLRDIIEHDFLTEDEAVAQFLRLSVKHPNMDFRKIVALIGYGALPESLVIREGTP